jgi:hypothetical protein
VKKQINQHKDLLEDPRYRHLVHRTKKEILHKQEEQEWKEELKNYGQLSDIYLSIKVRQMD